MRLEEFSHLYDAASPASPAELGPGSGSGIPSRGALEPQSPAPGSSAADFFGAPWAITEPGLQEAAAAIRRWLAAGDGDAPGARARAELELRNRRRPDQYALTADGVAIVELRGTMTKFGSWWSSMDFGTRGLRSALDAAAGAADVQSVMLVVDSPGGLVAGTADLAETVAETARRKPITAYIEDIGASAAYWVASQATNLVAGKTAMVGSIGTYLVVADFSGFFERSGVEVSVIRAGQHKGIGAFGAPITDADKAVLQETVEDLNSHFLDAVSRGRGFSAERTAELADGRVHIGPRALELGLVDSIGTFERALSDLADEARGATANSRRATSSAGSAKETETMSTPEKAPTGATLSELRASCPGACNDFIVEQLETGASAGEASRTYMAALVSERDGTVSALETASAELETAKAELETASAALEATAGTQTPTAERPGVPALGEGASTDAADSPSVDAGVSFRARVREVMAARKIKHHEASAVVAREEPAMHESYVREHNAIHNPGRRASVAI